MIQARRNELQLKAIKQDWWNNSETDRRTERAFLDEHKGPRRFSGKYEPQPVQTELDWKMPWGSWLDFKGLGDLSEAWKEAMKEFKEDGASTAVHQRKVSEQHFKRTTIGKTGMPCKLGLKATKKTLDGPASVTMHLVLGVR